MKLLYTLIKIKGDKMKKLVLSSIILIVGCATEPEEDNIIDLPTEFPLVANSGWVYEVSNYTNVEDFLSGNNSTITKDTLVILDTSQDYYLWHWGGSNIDSTSISWMYKNHENKLLFLGIQEILSEDVSQFFDKPAVWADFSDTFTIDTLNYDYPFIERTTTIDTLFENLYHTYVFSTNMELLPEELSDIPPLEFHYTQEGMSFYNGADWNAMDGMSFTTSKMIEKLDYIEININVE